MKTLTVALITCMACARPQPQEKLETSLLTVALLLAAAGHGTPASRERQQGESPVSLSQRVLNAQRFAPSFMVNQRIPTYGRLTATAQRWAASLQALGKGQRFRVAICASSWRIPAVHAAYNVGSATPAWANPRRRKTQASQCPHALPSTGS